MEYAYFIAFRGFSGGYVKEYIEASNPAFAIGEYWDSLAYEGGNLCYNQGSHSKIPELLCILHFLIFFYIYLCIYNRWHSVEI